MTATTYTREQIYQALFALLTPLGPSGTRDFITVSREVLPVQSIPPGKQPVLMMDEAFEDSEQGKGQRKATWTVYLHLGITTPKGTPGATVLNPLIDLVEQQINPIGGEPQDLGGMVTDVYIQGRAMKDVGDNQTDPKYRQAVYYMPITIILPRI